MAASQELAVRKGQSASRRCLLTRCPKPSQPGPLPNRVPPTTSCTSFKGSRRKLPRVKPPSRGNGASNLGPRTTDRRAPRHLLWSHVRASWRKKSLAGACGMRSARPWTATSYRMFHRSFELRRSICPSINHLWSRKLVRGFAPRGRRAASTTACGRCKFRGAPRHGSAVTLEQKLGSSWVAAER